MFYAYHVDAQARTYKIDVVLEQILISLSDSLLALHHLSYSACVYDDKSYM